MVSYLVVVFWTGFGVIYIPYVLVGHIFQMHERIFRFFSDFLPILSIYFADFSVFTPLYGSYVMIQTPYLAQNRSKTHKLAIWMTSQAQIDLIKKFGPPKKKKKKKKKKFF